MPCHLIRLIIINIYLSKQNKDNEVKSIKDSISFIKEITFNMKNILILGASSDIGLSLLRIAKDNINKIGVHCNTGCKRLAHFEKVIGKN